MNDPSPNSLEFTKLPIKQQCIILEGRAIDAGLISIPDLIAAGLFSITDLIISLRKIEENDEPAKPWYYEADAKALERWENGEKTPIKTDWTFPPID